MTSSIIAVPPAREAQRQTAGMAAQVRGLLSNPLIRSGVVYVFLLSGLFRLSAFIRETYIAARFGLSTATDAYYGLQQLPLSVSTFMFGAFALAFAPAYGLTKRRAGGPQWLPGLLLHGTLAGLALTAATMGLSSLLLGKYVGHADRTSVATLNILSTCYLPVIYLGIWTSMLNATGRALRSMTVAALPYLTMTASLIVICETTGADLLSLPVSMTLGFWLMGSIAAWKIYRSLRVSGGLRSVLWPLRFAEFRVFSKQMVASAAENVGFAGNQLLMIYFFGLMGAGEVTANNYAMRIGLLANSLITQPVAQLAQSKFCTVPAAELKRVFSRYLAWTLGAGGLAAGVIFLFREPVVALLYRHGRFTSNDTQVVTALIPAWLVYLLILSANSVASRYLFVIRKGNRYASFMLGGYLLTNGMRALCCTLYAYAPAIVWCAVIGEGAAMLLSLRTCYRGAPDTRLAGVAAVVS
jgi:putative peptidoglycan lipid II flippase